MTTLTRTEPARLLGEGAACTDCPQTWTGPTSRRDAKAHGRRHGHAVSVAVTRIETWHPKEEQS